MSPIALAPSAAAGTAPGATREPPPANGLAPPAEPLPRHISPTAAKNYLGCSLRFWFEKIACIRKPVSPALHLGKTVHAALQAFHLARWRGGDDSPEAVAAAYEATFLRLEREEGPVRLLPAPQGQVAAATAEQTGDRLEMAVRRFPGLTRSPRTLSRKNPFAGSRSTTRVRIDARV